MNFHEELRNSADAGGGQENAVSLLAEKDLNGYRQRAQCMECAWAKQVKMFDVLAIQHRVRGWQINVVFHSPS